jgi:hypothetical protein
VQGGAGVHLNGLNAKDKRQTVGEDERVAQIGVRQESGGDLEDEANLPPQSEVPLGRRPVFPLWLSRLGAMVLALLVVSGLVVAYVIHNAEPMLRQRVIANLEDRFHSPVELDTLHISLLRGLEVSGGGLRILYLAGPSQPDAQPRGAAPMVSVKSFDFRTGLWQLFEPTMRVVEVRVQGMQLNIPPKQDRGPLLQHDDAKRRGQPRMGLLIDKIVCSDVTLTIETNKPGKLPLVFQIRDVTLRDVGLKQPFAFEAWLVNPKPLGDIHSTGHFGPWQDDQPRDTPVDGRYSFTDADMATIKGISGTLSSAGEYSGTLGEIGVVGTTEIPDFALDVSEHPVDLRTQFNATVDGTSGDTRLNSVHATLRHTVLDVNGMVVRASGAQGQAAGGFPGDDPNRVLGHLIDLSVTSDQARIEDLLTLGAKTEPPILQGAMTLRAHLTIPPGRASVSQRMRTEGTFAIRGATFSNPKWQETLDKLSTRAQGHPEQANDRDAERVSSEMAGHFALANGMIDISKLNYKLPGAQVSAGGKYSMNGDTFDFDGTVRTQAMASQMLTGWKSIAAMPLDPLLKKNGAGLQIPIKISGTKSDPKLGLDLGKLGAQILSRHKGRAEQTPGDKP